MRWVREFIRRVLQKRPLCFACNGHGVVRIVNHQSLIYYRSICPVCNGKLTVDIVD